MDMTPRKLTVQGTLPPVWDGVTIPTVAELMAAAERYAARPNEAAALATWLKIKPDADEPTIIEGDR